MIIKADNLTILRLISRDKKSSTDRPFQTKNRPTMSDVSQVFEVGGIFTAIGDITDLRSSVFNR